MSNQIIKISMYN